MGRVYLPALGQLAVLEQPGGELLVILLVPAGDVDSDGDCHHVSFEVSIIVAQLVRWLGSLRSARSLGRRR
jgi:hypothetical protein